MNLKQITSEEAIEAIKQGKLNELWWQLDADELHKKKWFIEEVEHDSPRIN